MTFTFTVAPADWVGIAPIAVLVIMALVVMLVDLMLPHAGERSKHSGPANFTVLPIVSLIGPLGAIAATIVLLIGEQTRRCLTIWWQPMLERFMPTCLFLSL